MRIVVIGAAPTGLGAAYRLNELKSIRPEEAKDVELLILEQVSYAVNLRFNF
jgi:protoporphyrinogen oxidase